MKGQGFELHFEKYNLKGHPQRMNPLYLLTLKDKALTTVILWSCFSCLLKKYDHFSQTKAQRIADLSHCC